MVFEDILYRVARDRSSGAATTYDYVIAYLLKAIDDGLEPSSKDWSGFALSLFDLRPTMAPIFHLANDILMLTENNEPPNAALFRTSLMEMQAKEKLASKRLADNAAGCLTGNSFLTISSSSSVLASLLELSKTRSISVVVMESLPGGEGIETARFLSQNGVDVSLVKDTMVFEAAFESDAGLCGADWIGPDGVVNKVGTYSLATACREASIGCHVLATWSKCVPFSTDERMYNERKEEGFRWREQIFEKVPLAKVDWCINEEGLLPPSQLIGKIQAIRLAKAWKGTVSGL
jgi:translation initiation factor 2B subunit (eIF-2B alpha/beta/delta family)